MGEDLPEVRIHTGAGAAALASRHAARAVTIGCDVAFNDDQYRPGTLVGDALLAHELAHVAQQRGSAGEIAAAGAASHTAEPFEREADEVAIGAMLSLWGGADSRLRPGSRKRARSAGLRLQRCPFTEVGDGVVAATGDVPRYDLMTGADGQVVTQAQVQAVASMMKNEVQLDKVFADAKAGDKRARAIWTLLESTHAEVGTWIADHEYAFECTLPVYRELSGQCIINWSRFDYLSRTRPAGVRLREAIGETHARRAREKGIQNQIIGNSLMLLGAVATARGVLKPGPAEKAPVVAEKPPVVAEKPPVVAQKPPAVAEKPPAVAEKPPAVAEKPPAVAEKPPAVAEKPDFVGKLRGRNVTLPGVKTRRISYTKRDPAATAKLRAEFDSVARKRFVQELAGDPSSVARLKAAGVTDAQIEAMRARGAVPQGYQVHHKLPLDDGGTNASPNLVLIENEPFHKVITNSQASMTEGMKPGETRQLDFPIPEGSIYP